MKGDLEEVQTLVNLFVLIHNSGGRCEQAIFDTVEQLIEKGFFRAALEPARAPFQFKPEIEKRIKIPLFGLQFQALTSLDNNNNGE